MSVYVAIPKDWSEERFWLTVNNVLKRASFYGEDAFYLSVDDARSANIKGGANPDKFDVACVTMERLP